MPPNVPLPGLFAMPEICQAPPVHFIASGRQKGYTGSHRAHSGAIQRYIAPFHGLGKAI